jgi:hypothetical protein
MPPSEILASIRLVHAGQIVVPPEVAAQLLEFMSEDDRIWFDDCALHCCHANVERTQMVIGGDDAAATWFVA